MNLSRSRPSLAVSATMLCAGLVTAQFVAGKAARDAIYLANLDVTSLPQIVIATSVVSIALVFLSSKALRQVSSAAFVPLAFAASAMLFLVEWWLARSIPSIAARALYLHVSGIGPMLGSGFWLIATERFDPHTARKRFGQIAGAGTLGGVLGGLLSERIAAVLSVSTMLPVLAGLNLACAWQIRRLASPLETAGAAPAIALSTDLAPEPARSGLRALAGTPYLQDLAALVLLGTLAAALADYLFKAQAVISYGRGESLLRFFAAYYSATSLITFLVQTLVARIALERLGLAVSAGTPSLALLVGGIGGILIPGLPSIVIARGAEQVFRGSLFRSGYEVFYTPIPSTEKRAAKSIIDVGFDRLGDAAGGGMVQLSQFLAVSQQFGAILGTAIGCSALALVAASRLRRGYLKTLERSLLNRAVELDLSDVDDTLTRSAVLRTLRTRAASAALSGAASPSNDSGVRLMRDLDPEIHEIMELRSRDRDRVIRVLHVDEGLPAPLVPHVIPLLAWEPVADDAVHALRKVAEERVGELIDALLDPNQPFAVRRRLARVFSVCVSQRAVDGLMLGLDDLRFEVRFQCGRSLGAILEKNPRVRIDKEHAFRVVQREVTVGKPVWESRRLLDRLDDPEHRTFVDEFVEDRASQSLTHVFTLLALVLPTEPLRIAFRGLHTDDQRLRGTALEYLEGVLPPAIREGLWPFLEDRRATKGAVRPREEILADLLRSNQSIMLNIEELKRRANRPAETGASAAADVAPS